MAATDLAVEVGGAVILFGGLGSYPFVVVRGAARHERSVHKERRRAYRSHYAALEAAEDDADFAPEVIDICCRDGRARRHDLEGRRIRRISALHRLGRRSCGVVGPGMGNSALDLACLSTVTHPWTL